MHQAALRVIFVLGVSTVSLGLISGLALRADDALADKLLASAGVQRGLCVHLNCGEGALTLSLGKHPDLLVHGLEADSGLATKARVQLDQQAMHGRVSVATGNFARLPYADNLVNLVISESLGDGDQLREILRVLRPDGVALLKGGNAAAEVQRCIQTLKEARVEDVKLVEVDRAWLRFVKPKLAGVDDWTHLNHNAGGNRLSQDTLAGPPERLRWVDGVLGSTDANGPGAALSLDGRLFYHFDEAPNSKPQQNWSAIYARDAYNGLLLWKRPVSGFSPLCFAVNSQYVFSVIETKGTLVALDRDTGNVAHEYQAATFPDWVVFHAGQLYVAAGSRYGGKRVLCLDAETGEVRWQSDVQIRPSGSLPNFVVAGKIGYFLDWSGKKLGCLDLTSGTTKWEQDISQFLTEMKWRYGLCSHGHGTLIVGEGMRGQAIHAFSDADGQHRWSHQYPLVLSGRSARHKGSTYDGGFFIDGLFWTHVGRPQDAPQRGAEAWEGLDPATGQVQRRFAYDPDVAVGDSCHRAQATVNYFMGGHTRFVSTKTGEYAPRAYGIHNSCHFGMLPANGLTYTWSQYTNTYVRGLLGLTTSEAEQTDRLSDARGCSQAPPMARSNWRLTARPTGLASDMTRPALPQANHLRQPGRFRSAGRSSSARDFRHRWPRTNLFLWQNPPRRGSRHCGAAMEKSPGDSWPRGRLRRRRPSTEVCACSAAPMVLPTASGPTTDNSCGSFELRGASG